jgi:hypothetical protein
LSQRRRLKKFSHFPLPTRSPIKSPSELLLELPDTEEDIACQERSLENFTLFPYLPTELRLAIWRKILPPPRLFNLEQECASLFRCQRSHYHHPHLPVTLRINRESRDETLRHYQIIYIENTGSLGTTKKKPMLFGPRRDMVFLRSVDDFLFKMFAVNTQFRSKVPLEGVRELTISEVTWEDKEKFILTLMLFSRLQKLNLIEARNGSLPKWFQNTDKDGGLEFRKDLLESSEEKRRLDPKWSVPKITMLPYQRVSKGIWK